MRSTSRLIVLPLLAVLGGCNDDTKYEGNMLLTHPDSLSARLVPGVTREEDVSSLLGSDRGHLYGVIRSNGQFVGCEHGDQDASKDCPFVERTYITLRKRTGRYLLPNQTDAWRATLVFDGTGVLRIAHQEYFEGRWDWFGIR